MTTQFGEDYATLCPKCHFIFDMQDYMENKCPRCGHLFETED